MDRAVDEASHLYSRYGADDLESVARQLGIAVYDFLEATHLREVYFPELKAIVVRPAVPRHERRYLIAHALGHHVLHASGPARHSLDYLRLHMQRTEQSSEQQALVTRIEREADLFAGYLLVPSETLEPVLAEAWVGESNNPALQLAIEFQVPLEPMRLRLAYERSRRLSHHQ